MPEQNVSRPSTSSADVTRRAAGMPPGAGRAAGAGQIRPATTIRRFAIAFAAVGLISVGCYLVAYLRTGAWQIVVAGGAVLLGLLFALLAFLLARGGRVDAAGYLLLVALTVVYATAELTWSNATPYLVVTGTLLILFAGGALFPRRWGRSLLILGCFGIAILLISQFEPLPRFDLRKSPLLDVYVPAVNILLAAFLIWRGLRAYRQVATIRARLLIVSIGTVLLTAAAVSAGTIIVGYRNGREQAIDRLELVASLRQIEIDGWISDVQDTLAGSLQQAPEHRFVEPEMANVVAALIDTPEGSEQYQNTYDFLSYNFELWLKQSPAFEVVFFMDRDGNVLVSSDPAMEGRVFAEETYFQRGTVGSFIAPPYYDQSLDQVTVFTSRPILGEYGRLLGVLAGRVDASTLSRLMRLREQASLGDTGETYLVGEDLSMLTRSRFSEVGTSVQTEGARAALEQQGEGSDAYLNYQGNHVIGVYRWLPDLNVALLAEQSRAEAFSTVNTTVRHSAAVALAAVFIAGVVSLSVARTIGDPLSDLAEVASGIAAGDLERTARVERKDEIGTLAEAFNTMTSQLRGLIGQLEQRVAQRTQELETRSAYLEASAEVGHAASTVLDAEDLIETVVDLIRHRFDLYYTGLFLLDETGQWAELRAGTGQAGQEMLAQEHRLRVGGESMIGQCVARREARIALDVGAEAVRFDNPLLPRTRSEAALPLQSRGRMFGAITVQSDEPAAFDEDTVTVLQTMADQVAVALDNAYLFAEAEQSLQAARRASAEMSREGWARMLRSQPQLGYHSDERGVIRAQGSWRPEMEEAFRAGKTVRTEDGSALSLSRARSRDPAEGPDAQLLAVPIKVAGKVIGVLDTYKPREAGPWTDEEVEMLESMVEQMAVSLESARLYQETQSRAAREQMVADVTGRLRASLDPDTILKTTVREIGRVLNAELASVELVPSSDGGNGGASPGRDPSAGGQTSSRAQPGGLSRAKSREAQSREQAVSREEE